MSRFFNYGAKNGVWSIIHAVVFLCKIYNVFLVPIRDYVNGHGTLTTQQKSEIIAWLDGAQNVCYLLQSQVEVTYEPRG